MVHAVDRPPHIVGNVCADDRAVRLAAGDQRRVAASCHGAPSLAPTPTGYGLVEVAARNSATVSMSPSSIGRMRTPRPIPSWLAPRLRSSFGADRCRTRAFAEVDAELSSAFTAQTTRPRTRSAQVISAQKQCGPECDGGRKAMPHPVQPKTVEHHECPRPGRCADLPLRGGPPPRRGRRASRNPRHGHGDGSQFLRIQEEPLVPRTALESSTPG